MQSANPGVIRVRPGLSVMDLARRSSTAISLDKREDYASIVIEGPLVVEYADEAAPLLYPATLAIFITQYAGVVTNFSFAPQRSYLSLPKCFELAVSQIDTLTKSGWRPDEAPKMDYSTIEQRFKVRGADVRFGTNFGTWRRGAVEVSVFLEEAPHIEGPPPQPDAAAMLLNLSFSDDALKDKASKLVYAERKKVNGDENIPLPLTHWLNR